MGGGKRSADARTPADGVRVQPVGLPRYAAGVVAGALAHRRRADSGVPDRPRRSPAHCGAGQQHTGGLLGGQRFCPELRAVLRAGVHRRRRPYAVQHDVDRNGGRPERQGEPRSRRGPADDGAESGAGGRPAAGRRRRAAVRAALRVPRERGRQAHCDVHHPQNDGRDETGAGGSGARPRAACSDSAGSARDSAGAALPGVRVARPVHVRHPRDDAGRVPVALFPFNRKCRRACPTAMWVC